jgi:DNA invertase Pin-like site-specific DNA recombinase
MRGFIAFLSAMAEDERQRIMKRAGEGRAAARAKGVRFGRKPKLTPPQIEEVRRRRAAGENTYQLGAIFNVSHATISRATN